tara:strand:- start:1946 stop:2314 length:369 start_codon:yes stop_codon:yes gene_type:complete
MAYAPDSVGFHTGDGSILGSFREASDGRVFEFSRNPNHESIAGYQNSWGSEFPHLIWVGSSTGHSNGYRFGRVYKTTLKIVTDEGDLGLPVIEQWQIKNYRLYRKLPDQTKTYSDVVGLKLW